MNYKSLISVTYILSTRFILENKEIKDKNNTD